MGNVLWIVVCPFDLFLMTIVLSVLLRSSIYDLLYPLHEKSHILLGYFPIAEVFGLIRQNYFTTMLINQASI